MIVFGDKKVNVFITDQHLEIPHYLMVVIAST